MFLLRHGHRGIGAGDTMGADITTRQLAASVLFLGTFFVLAHPLIATASIQILIEGEQVVSHNLKGIFTYQDILIIVAAALMLGGSACYLGMSIRSCRSTPFPEGTPAAEMVLGERRKRWESVSLSLKDQERAVYEVILSSDGIMLQSDIVSALPFSKSTVSRVLDLLESKGLVERRRRGMGNVIMLQ